MNIRSNRWSPLLMISAFFALSLFFLKAATNLAWFCGTWAGFAFVGILSVKGSLPRAILLNLGVAFLTLAAAELYFSHLEPVPPVTTDGYYIRNDVLGTAPARSTRAHSTLLRAGHLLYDVDYTIGADGLRISPPWNPSHLDGTILFFGCSFTYGEGLEDNETMPFQVGSQSAGRYRVFNFAFHGYGPHQMLAALEHGFVMQTVDTRPQFAIYTALPHHVWRVAGKVPYGQHSPRYLLNPDGTLTQAGDFAQNQLQRRSLRSIATEQFRKSAIYRTLVDRDPPVTDADITLYLAIVRKSRDFITSQYPGLRFDIILWPAYSKAEQQVYQKLKSGFQRLAIPVHYVEDILPGFTTTSSRYLIDPSDQHPNALADRTIAAYVLAKIISR